MFADAPRRRPRRVLARAAALSGTALLGAALLAWSPQPATGWDQSAAEATLWQLLNGDRTNNGLAPLTQHSTLVSLARWRSKDMVDRDYFSHVVLGTGYQVYYWYDLNHLSWSSGGENIGWNNGYSDADSPVKINEGFMNSAGHRANILNTAWTDGGVGAYGADNVDFLGVMRNPRVYTELFMQAKASPPPPPPPTPAPPPPPPPTSAPTPEPPKPTSQPPAPTGTPHQAPLETATPTEAPTPTDQPTPTGASSFSPAAVTVHTFVGDDGPDAPGRSGSRATASSMRVQPAAATDRGIFETVIGALLSLFLG